MVVCTYVCMCLSYVMYVLHAYFILCNVIYVGFGMVLRNVCILCMYLCYVCYVCMLLEYGIYVCMLCMCVCYECRVCICVFYVSL